MAHIFQQLDGSGQLDLAPGPLCPGGVEPEPEIRFPVVGVLEPMVLTYDGERFRPGQMVSVNAGTDFSHGLVQVRLPVARTELVDELKSLRDAGEQFVWSPDGGATLIVVEYQPGDSALVATPARFKPGWYVNVQVNLRTIEILSGSGS